MSPSIIRQEVKTQNSIKGDFFGFSVHVWKILACIFLSLFVKETFSARLSSSSASSVRHTENAERKKWLKIQQRDPAAYSNVTPMSPRVFERNRNGAQICV